MSVFCRWMLAAAMLTSAAPLPADDVLFGLEIHNSFPQADLKNVLGEKMYMGLSGFAMLDLYGGHAIKASLGFSSSRSDDFHKRAVGPGHALKIKTYSLGMDYHFFFNRRTGEGCYLLLGGGCDRLKTTWDSPAGPRETSQWQPSIQGGIGIIAVPNIGFEARYVMGRYPSFDASGNAWTGRSDRLEVGVMFLF